MSVQKATCRAILFDMDGTLIDSTAAIEASWKEYAKRHNLDVEMVLNSTHGSRSVDNLGRIMKLTPAEAEQEATRFESLVVEKAQETGIPILPGASTVLETLAAAGRKNWAIVTSATPAYAGHAMPTAGLPSPPQLVTAYDTPKGKPNPDPYLKGAEKLGIDIKDCIVIEDAPLGIKAGLASGAKTIGVCTSHKRSQIETVGADWVITDLSKLGVSVKDDLIHLDIDLTP